MQLLPTISTCVLLILPYILADTVQAQTYLQKPRKVRTPEQIEKLINGKITETQAIDFNGDKKRDYIAVVERKTEDGEIIGTEYWITSDLKVVKETIRFNADIQERWFINLDNDRVPEIVSAFGYEDGIEYAVYKQDFKNKKDILLFLFNPVLIDSSRQRKRYWGYPWDWIDIRVRRSGNHYEVLCTFDHEMDGDFAVVEIPEWQKRVPVIFFSGRTTQPQSLVREKVGLPRWMNVSDIAKQARHSTR